MSHIRWVPGPSERPPASSGWRFFPWLVAAGIGVVVMVNAALVYAALASFPGKTGDAGFELSNKYDAVLDRARREADLGWAVSARTDGFGRPEVILIDRQGSPLRGALVAASARRPVGAADMHRLEFHEAAAGKYVADTTLTEPGQWDLTLKASAGGREVAATRRIIVQ